MVTLNNQNLQTSFDRDGYISISPLFSVEKVEEIKNELIRYIKEVAPNVPDHHIFSLPEVKKIEDEARVNNCQIIMTEKDYFKIRDFKFENAKYDRGKYMFF